jgi:hypothetical protein
MVLSLWVVPSCSESFSTVQSVPRGDPAVVMLDLSVLKSLGERKLYVGERLSAVVDASVTQVARSEDLVLRDTSVVSVDEEGVVYARAAGSSWAVWSAAASRDAIAIQDSTLVTVVSATGAPSASQQVDWTHPTAPERTVDVRYPSRRTRGLSDGKEWTVANGGDLQGALNSAQPGDEIVLAADAVFIGNFVLPMKQSSASGWIIVRSEVVATPAGSRTSPELSAHDAKIITANQNAAVITAPGARNWRLVGLDISHAKGAIYNYGIVVLGRGDEKAVSLMPSNIVLDRVFIHGSPTDGTSRCVAFNGSSLAVIDSWLIECHAKGQDSQGVGGWGGPGPFLIENNRIEASGQAVMFGGADPAVANLTPSDIIIRRNYMFKPISWANGVWEVKAAFELKHAQRVLFEGNVIENHWTDAQVGFAILFQPSQDASAGWAVVNDILIQHNIVRNSTSGVDILARYQRTIVTPASRIAFVNNLFQDVGRDPINNAIAGRILQLIDGVQDVTFENNTVTLDGVCNQAVGLSGSPTVRTTILNNVFPASGYGVFGDSKGSGTPALATYAPDGVLSNNVLPGQNADVYPPNNFFPATRNALIFEAPINGDYSLSSINPFFMGTSGPVGVNNVELAAHVRGVRQ